MILVSAFPEKPHYNNNYYYYNLLLLLEQKSQMFTMY